MRPSIAAALSTLGPLHSADTVLLTATDVDRFADVEGPDEGNRRVVVRPDGSLLLVVEFDAPTFAEVRYALVGAVPKDAWTWADPKKRQPAPLARVNLDARDIHCLTQGGEIHRGATVGTTPTGLVALQAATSKAARIAALNHDDCVDAIRFAFTTRTPKPAAPVRPVAHATFTVDEFGRMLTEFGRTGKVTRTPKDGDTLESFTAKDLDALPEGSKFVRSDCLPLTKQRHGSWKDEGSSCSSTYNSLAALNAFAHRTLLLPVATRTSKDGDRLDSFTAAEIDALPEGAQFVGPTHDPADPGGPGYLPLTKGADGRWHGLRTPLTFAAVSMLSGRTLLLPVAKRTPKDGDRIDSFTAAELDGLPVGARFDDNNNGLSPLVKGPHGWSRAGAAGFCTSADVKALCCADRTLVLPKPTEAPKLAASPKVGDRLRDLTPEQRANLPIGTVVTRICLGREASAVLTLDRASGSSDVTGAVWLVTFNGETREVPAEDLADDNAIVILPTLPPPPPAPKVGDRWGNLTPDQRAALPAGTVLDGTGSLPPVVKVGSGWVCVEDGGKVGGFVPERTIAFLPVSK